MSDAAGRLPTRAALILAAAGLALAAAAVAQVNSSIAHRARTLGVPRDSHFGNGVVVRGDGVGYYAWLRSAISTGTGSSTTNSTT